MTKLTYVSSSHGDWCGIYVGDTLQTEGHSIPVHEWLDLIDTCNFNESSQQLEVDGEWLEESGSFPTFFSDIPEEKFV